MGDRKREQRGEENIIEALAVQMSDVFYSEILPKLDLISTLNLAQVSKSCNDAVWSVDGVRSMEAKMEAMIKAEFKAPLTSYSSDPLCFAAIHGNAPAVRALLKYGVDVNVNFNLNCTPLHYAAGHGHTPVVKVLIEAGADVDKKGHCGKTSLHVAAIEGHAPVIMKLIKAGADVNATDDYGNTPLHYATRSREEDCIALLLVLGAGVHKAPKRWITLMRIAVQRKYNKIIEMLKQAG
jgi:ankyrin repeat protein